MRSYWFGDVDEHGCTRAEGDLEALAGRLTNLLATPDALAAAAAAARNLGRPDAAERLADLVIECAGANGGMARERAA